MFIHCYLYGKPEKAQQPTAVRTDEVSSSRRACCCGDARRDVLTLRLGVGINYSYFVGASEQGSKVAMTANAQPKQLQLQRFAFKFIDVLRRLMDDGAVWFGGLVDSVSEQCKPR
ncbi:unnamed protein product [Ceratitis capitata]|uniref:(Mediterranean fruit fly) hypothetical protein n=1 Tax=Ceratitis capitata TaxID=7213 RepID=A0A811UNB3_CERCA|nr:unnamed protein product [Ceratitis capitata]